MVASEIELASAFELPWWVPSDADLMRLSKELQRELAPGHVLHGETAVAVACRCDCDDVLFRVGVAPYRYAVVHLSFVAESNPTFPRVEVFGSFGDVVAGRLKPDVDEYGH